VALKKPPGAVTVCFYTPASVAGKYRPLIGPLLGEAAGKQRRGKLQTAAIRPPKAVYDVCARTRTSEAGRFRICPSINNRGG